VGGIDLVLGELGMCKMTGGFDGRVYRFMGVPDVDGSGVTTGAVIVGLFIMVWLFGCWVGKIHGCARMSPCLHIHSISAAYSHFLIFFQ
jgi:hypothetical protein